MIKPFYTSDDKLFTLYNNDCNDVLLAFKNTFDLILTDPPYFLSNDGFTVNSGKVVSVNKGEWDRNEDIEKIYDFNLQWLNKAKAALKDTGTIMVSGTYHNIFTIGYILQKLDFKILNVIVWKKTNPPPNFSCRYLTHSTEHIIWAKKNYKAKHIYNYEIMKKINGGKQMQDTWNFPAVSAWEKYNGKHPTQKPLALLVRLIMMSTNGNSLVCDPFSGSSGTGIAANLLNRSFVGIEREKDFIDLSLKRKLELVKNADVFKSKLLDLKHYF